MRFILKSHHHNTYYELAAMCIITATYFIFFTLSATPSKDKAPNRISRGNSPSSKLPCSDQQCRNWRTFHGQPLSHGSPVRPRWYVVRIWPVQWERWMLDPQWSQMRTCWERRNLRRKLEYIGRPVCCITGHLWLCGTLRLVRTLRRS